jgi:hypothetical protein
VTKLRKLELSGFFTKRAEKFSERFEVRSFKVGKSRGLGAKMDNVET